MRSRPDLELVQRRGARATGRRDHVAQFGRMHAARLGEERAALEGLDDEVMGDVAREPEVHGRVDERLHDEEHIGGSGATDRRRHRDHPLVVHRQLGSERFQEGGRLLPLLGGDLRRRVPDRHPLAQSCRRVRHAPHDGAMPEYGRERGRGRSGDDADDELSLPEVAGKLPPDSNEHLRLNSQHDDVGLLHRLEVGRRDPDGVVAFQLRPAVPARMAGNDLGRLHLVATEQAGDHRLGHDARAYGRDRAFVEGRHGRSIADRLAPARVSAPRRFAATSVRIGAARPPRLRHQGSCRPAGPMPGLPRRRLRRARPMPGVPRGRLRRAPPDARSRAAPGSPSARSPATPPCASSGGLPALGASFPSRAPVRQGLLEAEPEERVLACPAQALGAQQDPALEVGRGAGPMSPAAPQALERRPKRHQSSVRRRVTPVTGLASGVTARSRESRHPAAPRRRTPVDRRSRRASRSPRSPWGRAA